MSIYFVKKKVARHSVGISLKNAGDFIKILCSVYNQSEMVYFMLCQKN